MRRELGDDSPAQPLTAEKVSRTLTDKPDELLPTRIAIEEGLEAVGIDPDETKTVSPGTIAPLRKTTR